MLIRYFYKIPLYLLTYYQGFALSQSNSIYYHKNPSPIKEGKPVEISQLMFTDKLIESGILFFKDKGEISFQETVMELIDGKWIGIIPGDRVTLKGLEYVTILATYDGGRIALPNDENPFENPLSISVTADLEKSNLTVNDDNEELGKADILILSPEEGSFNRPGEVVISVSLFNAPNVDQRDFKIYINGQDYSDEAIISGDVLSLVPEKSIGYGFQQVKILFKTEYGLNIKPLQWSYSTSKSMTDIAESFKYKGKVSTKKSSNTVSNISINEQEISGNIDAELSWVKGSYSFRSSSRESKFAQKVNRNSLRIQMTDYLKIENGDIYPLISPYVINGKKVNGRNTEAYVPFGFGFDGFNLFGRNLLSFGVKGSVDIQYTSGYLARAVQYQNGLDRAYDLISDDIEYDNSGNRIYLFDRKGYTFPRKLNSFRLSLSLYDRYKIGFHYLKAKDDYEKINVQVGNDKTFTVDPGVFDDSLSRQFTLSEFIDSLTNGDTVSIKNNDWNHKTPQENLVIGFDLEGSLDGRKLLLQTGWNMSFTNSNIWPGVPSKESLDLLMDTIPDGKLLGNYDVESIGDFIDSYSDFFTINPLYMIPILPIDPIIAENNSIKAILNMPASAYFIRAKSNYSFNSLLFEYRQLGAGYKSFGNPYLTNNIRELTLTDRLTTLGRRLMLVFTYKYRDNKLSDLIVNPIATKTFSINTTLVPGSGAPSIILNIQSIGKTNGIDSVDTDKYGNYLGDSRENSQALNIMASINIPEDFGLFKSVTSINVNSITYKDNLDSDRRTDFFFQKAENKSFSLSFSADFKFPLKTNMSFNQSKIFIPYLDENSIARQQINTWTSFNNRGQYSILNNKVRIKGGLNYTTNGVGFNLYGGNLGGDWYIADRLTLSVNSSIRLDNKKDGLDNDGDGIVDEGTENFTVNNSGLNINLGYRF